MVNLSLFEFPFTLLQALALVIYLIARRRGAEVCFLSSRTCSAIILLTASLLIAIEGTYGVCIHRHWTFVLLVLLAILALAYTASADWKRRSYMAFLSHLGLCLVLFGGMSGAPDCRDLSIRLYEQGTADHLAFDAQGNVEPLPFQLALEDFRTDYHSDGISPRQYTSIFTADGRQLETSVNHPCRYKGYRIYQSGYGPGYSTLKLVRDPWLPLVALGALLLAVSAFMGLKQAWDSRKILATAVALAFVFGVISVARIRFGTLPPALRSLWFVPHLIVYMLAYSLMALSVIAGVASLFTGRIPARLSGRLLRTSSSLLLIGMLCGAVWAKQAWGQYWTWDPKECWAAVTWLLTLAAIHIPGRKTALAFTVASFLAMQITWYGVNYLPSSSNSLHTYNKESSV